MKPYRFTWFYQKEKIGEIELRIVETRDEAEDPDHCWCGNSRIFEHLEKVKQIEHAKKMGWCWWNKLAEQDAAGQSATAE